MIKVKPSQNAGHPKTLDNSTCLVTGAGGSIGVHVVLRLLAETNWNLVLLDSYKTVHKGSFDRISHALKDYPESRYRVKNFVHDLQTPFSEREVKELTNVDYVIHLASLSDVQDSINNPLPFIQNNINLQAHILELARSLPNLKRFYHMSTDEVRGSVSWESKGHIESSYYNPSNIYSATKSSQEMLCISYWKSYDLPIVIGNIMNNFGEYQSASKFNTIIQNKVSNGEKVSIHVDSNGKPGTRYYLHSSNTAAGILFLLLNTEHRSHVAGTQDEIPRFNIVGDREVSNLELAQIISKMMDKPLDYELVNFHDTKEGRGHDLRYGLDGTLMDKMGFVPPMTFEESLQQLIEFGNENPEWIK